MKFRITTISSIILFFCFSMMGQSTESKLFKVGFNDRASSIYLDQENNQFLILGVAVCDSFQGCEFILVLDSQLFITSLTIFDSMVARAFQDVWLNDNFAFYLGQPSLEVDSAATIYKLKRNSNGEYQMTDEWRYEQANIDLSVRTIDLIKNGTLVVCTFWNQEPSGTSLMNVDTSSGNILWDTVIYDSPDYRIFQFFETQAALDGGIILQGSYLKQVSQEPDFFAWKMDSFGKLLWQTIFPSESSWGIIDNQVGIAENSIGEIAIAHENDSKVQVSKLDSDGNILWTQTFDHNGEAEAYRDDFKYIRNLEFTANGDIIGAGNDRLYEPVVGFVGWMFRISAEGELLWERRYTHYVSEYDQGDSRERGALSALVELNNGDLLAVGDNNDTLLFEGQIYNDFDAWVLRVDEDGCLFPDCADDDDQLYTGVISIPDAQLSFAYQLFPNPTSNQLQLKLGVTCRDCSFQIHSSTGQTLQHIKSISELQYSIDCSSWTPGWYPWIIRYGSEVVAQGKIFIVR